RAVLARDTQNSHLENIPHEPRSDRLGWWIEEATSNDRNTARKYREHGWRPSACPRPDWDHVIYRDPPAARASHAPVASVPDRKRGISAAGPAGVRRLRHPRRAADALSSSL